MERDAYSDALDTLSLLFEKKKASELTKRMKPKGEDGKAVAEIVSKTVGDAVQASNGNGR